jgi:hypothetical protein
LCPVQKGLPSGPGDGFSLVPVAHTTNQSSYAWCGGKTNKHLPVTQTWNQSCRSVYNDVNSIIDGVYGDGLPFLMPSSPYPTKNACHSNYKAKVTINRRSQ